MSKNILPDITTIYHPNSSSLAVGDFNKILKHNVEIEITQQIYEIILSNYLRYRQSPEELTNGKMLTHLYVVNPRIEITAYVWKEYDSHFGREVCCQTIKVNSKHFDRNKDYVKDFIFSAAYSRSGLTNTLIKCDEKGYYWVW